MAGDPSKMTLWTGYFDSKLTRSSGRRVSKEASIPQPSLDALAWAASKVGIRKMKKQPEASHPSRPHTVEGRLVLSTADAMEATGADSKEGVMRAIGLRMRSEMKQSKEEGRSDSSAGPAKGDRRKRAQRKSFKKQGGQRKKKFGRK
ncbi:MAG: signal recognition particle subunit SRP19/SEC65 family protein [Candidatus Thermoplasmatota archaeon]|jgi:signal recognition particle subunit SEC65|nr:signal recognition particle subunit SRP19/SEC65 family protein [Candidatus Thermoplasmatota archaeon]